MQIERKEILEILEEFRGPRVYVPEVGNRYVTKKDNWERMADEIMRLIEERRTH